VIYDEARFDDNTQGLARYGKLFPSTGKPGEVATAVHGHV
jgi:hypothetical protein